jgi:hypothetical protein
VSADRALPWWASDGPVDGGVDRVADPVERHRAARRGGREPDEPSQESVSPAEPVPLAEPARHRVDACGVCPFCTSMRLLQDTRPELVEHLTEAARHLAAAARSLLDTPVPGAADRGERAAPQGSGDRPRARPVTGDGRLQRIVLDDGPRGSAGAAHPGAAHPGAAHPGAACAADAPNAADAPTGDR